jgi:uncharacterized repeat protein (TIGR04076 family)
MSLYNVKVTVTEVKNCSSGLKVGDSFQINAENGIKIKGCDGWCPEAVQTVIPPCMIMMHGGTLPWEDEYARATSHCPDPGGIVMAVQRDEKIS